MCFYFDALMGSYVNLELGQYVARTASLSNLKFALSLRVSPRPTPPPACLRLFFSLVSNDRLKCNNPWETALVLSDLPF